MTVRVIGDKALAAGLRRAASRLADLADPTREAARAVARTAARRAPKRTGRLARGHSVTVTGGTGVVSNTVRYAGFVEDGTRYMRAQPFLRPSLLTTPITDYYERHADNAVRGL